MPREAQLSQKERQIIRNHLDAGTSPTSIAQLIGCSKWLIYNVINNPTKDHPDTRSGRPQKLSIQVYKALIRTTRKPEDTTRTVQQSLQLNLDVSPIRRHLRNDPFFCYRRMHKGPAINENYHAKCVEWENNQFLWSGEQRGSIVWSDEKRFTFNRPDWMECCWHDRTCKQRIFSKSHCGEGELMVWGNVVQRFYIITFHR